MTVFIQTEPLPPGRAHLVVNLIQDIISLHPCIDGFILTGSIWSPNTQLPYSDIDINWHVTKNDSINDPCLNPHSFFQ